MKICSKCKQLKELKDFYKAKKCEFGVRPDCKVCNIAGRSAYHKIAKENNPEQRRSVILKSKYGITVAVFNKMLKDQDYKCKICKSLDPGPKGTFAVDHCHKTNKVRGLLCYLCNMGLGSFRDNEEFLTSAVTYLKETSNG